MGATIGFAISQAMLLDAAECCPRDAPVMHESTWHTPPRPQIASA
jgi:hypothetical protein